jgi:hypothetical protein
MEQGNGSSEVTALKHKEPDTQKSSANMKNGKSKSKNAPESCKPAHPIFETAAPKAKASQTGTPSSQPTSHHGISFSGKSGIPQKRKLSES